MSIINLISVRDVLSQFQVFQFIYSGMILYGIVNNVNTLFYVFLYK